jgi:hypothetical protein
MTACKRAASSSSKAATCCFPLRPQWSILTDMRPNTCSFAVPVTLSESSVAEGSKPTNVSPFFTFFSSLQGSRQGHGCNPLMIHMPTVVPIVGRHSI